MKSELTQDCISRQDAIDAFDGTKVDADEEYCHEYAMGYNDGIDFAVSKLSVLPSAQPLDVQMAYYMGLKDGVKECNERLEKFIDEMRRQG